MLNREGESPPRQDSRYQGRRNQGKISGGGVEGVLVYLCLLQPLGFCSSVLEPDLDLSFRDSKTGRKLCSLRDCEITFGIVLLLQLAQLLVGEGCSRLAIRFVFPKTDRFR